MLILSSNNYLGLCDEPSVIEAGIDGLQAIRRRHGERALHLRHVHDPPRARGRAREVRRHARRRCRFVSAWNANEGFTATIARRGRLRRVGRAESRVDHRLDAAGEGDHRSARPACTSTATWTTCATSSCRAKAAKRRIIWTDGIFSMEGAIAKLPDILQIARDHDAIVVVDDSHATGVLGKTGRGTAEHFGVLGEVDVITSTLGKALGGAAGGFVAGSAALADYLTQRSRPQLFSNALPPTVATSALAAVRFVEAASGARRDAARRTRVLPRADHRGGIQAARRARRRSFRSSSARRRRRFR